MRQKQKALRRSLWASVLAILLCAAMLLGTTFAWFSDTVTSGKNKIEAGNLDVDLKYAKVDPGADLTADTIAWDTVEDQSDLFEESTLWEPGHVEVAYLKIENLGTLALDYNLRVYAAEETRGTNVKNRTFWLSSYLNFGVVENVAAAYTDRADAVKAVTEVHALDENDFTLESNEETYLTAGTSKTVALVVWMPETVGNIANYKTGTAIPTINLGVRLEATQAQHEEDSFGNTYDADADGMPDHPEFGDPIDKVATVPGVIKVDPVADGDTTSNLTVAAKRTVTAGNISVTYPVGAKLNREETGEPNDDNRVNAPQGLVPTGAASKHNIEISAGETLSVYELTLPVAEDNDVLVKITKNIGTSLQVTELYHEGVKLDNREPNDGEKVTGDHGFYNYNPTTGTLTIWVNHSSEVTLKVKGLFAGGAGTEADPYLVSTTEQFVNISVAPTKTFFKLTDNITVPEAQKYSDPWGDAASAGLTRLISKTLDGDGHTITAPENGYLFGDVRNSTIKNVTVELNGETMTYFAMDSTFDGITTKGNAELTGNSAAFLTYPYFDFTMKNCTNEAKLTAGGAWNNYNAVFVGYGALSSGYTLTFDNCVNKGSLVCGTASMFIGNISYGKPKIVINNCRNEGLIQATYMGSGYIFNPISSVNSDGQDSLATYTFNGASKTCAEMRALPPVDTFGGTWIHGPSDADLALTLNPDGTTFTITPSQNPAVASYKLSVGVYGTIVKGGSKLHLIVVDVPDTANAPLQKLEFVDDTWVAANPTAERVDHEGYTIYALGGKTYYLYDCNNGEFTLKGNPKMATEFAISAYDASGNLVASAGLTQ